MWSLVSQALVSKLGLEPQGSLGREALDPFSAMSPLSCLCLYFLICETGRIIRYGLWGGPEDCLQHPAHQLLGLL